MDMILYGYHPVISKLIIYVNIYLTWMLSTMFDAEYAKVIKSRSLPSTHAQSELRRKKHNIHYKYYPST